MTDLIIKGAGGIKDGLYVIKDGEMFKYKSKGGTVRTYPIADRPKGEWIRTDFEDCVDGEHIKWARWNCSECGVEKKIWWVKDVNFCPNCGADMRGGENE